VLAKRAHAFLQHFRIALAALDRQAAGELAFGVV
jgi:hypothetical protein